MDNLKIYLNTNNLLKVKGKLRDLKDGELIQARLLKSNLMLSITDNPEFFNSKFMYFNQKPYTIKKRSSYRIGYKA